jgi:cytochrome c biogenesis protein CcdA
VDTTLLALALVAGAVATVNPCGFALLPAYLTILVVGPDGPEGDAAGPGALVRGLRFAAGMTVGFVAVFAAAGLLLVPLAVRIQDVLPGVTIVIGVVLILIGAWLLTGRHLSVPFLRRRGIAPQASWWTQVGYGVTFALASLSCTIGPFLAVTAGVLAGGNVGGGLVAFIAYALGMGVVVAVLAVLAATAGTVAAARLRRAGPVIERLGGLLLVLAGLYVTWYGWFEVRVAAGGDAQDPVVAAASSLQGALTNAVASLGPVGLLVTLAVLALAVTAVAIVGRRRSRRAAQTIDA